VKADLRSGGGIGADMPRQTGTRPLPVREAAVEGKPARTVFSSSGAGLLDLAAGLGLPKDRLSASILSFFRFFSLPLTAESIANIRSRALGVPLPDRAENAGGAENSGGAESGEADGPGGAELSQRQAIRFREAVALAAAAAMDKGEELDQKALEQYARAIDPRSRKEEAPRGGDDSGRSGQGDSPEGGNPGGAGLDLLNRRRGRGGKQWIVIPFTWGPAEEYRVALRILVNSPDARGFDEKRTPDRMALDIAGKDAHWLFIFERIRQKDAADGLKNRGMNAEINKERSFTLSFGRWPPPKTGGGRDGGGLEAMKRELSALLGLPRSCISVLPGGTFPPFAPDGRDELLLSVNEEV
jgi:hypothetical protein